LFIEHFRCWYAKWHAARIHEARSKAGQQGGRPRKSKVKKSKK
jgi:hypothetical protein